MSGYVERVVEAIYDIGLSISTRQDIYHRNIRPHMEIILESILFDSTSLEKQAEKLLDTVRSSTKYNEELMIEILGLCVLYLKSKDVDPDPAEHWLGEIKNAELYASLRRVYPMLVDYQILMVNYLNPHIKGTHLSMTHYSLGTPTFRMFINPKGEYYLEIPMTKKTIPLQPGDPNLQDALEVYLPLVAKAEKAYLDKKWLKRNARILAVAAVLVLLALINFFL